MILQMEIMWHITHLDPKTNEELKYAGLCFRANSCKYDFIMF